MREDDDPPDPDRPSARLSRFFEGLSEEAREFTRRKPLEGLFLSFVAGLLVGELLRRQR